MNTNFDPRAWNLVTGVALLAAGCGSRVAANETETTGDETDDATTTVTTPEETAEGPECMTYSDCPTSYACVDGVCVYSPPSDGWTPYYDCYGDHECAQFELCENGYCDLLGSPPPSCTEQGLDFSSPVPLPVDEAALALSFADVDGDGQDELVIATPTELLVYEHGGMAPTVSAREPGDNDSMIAGSFDATPGEDVMLWADGDLLLYGSNGDGSFAMPVTTASPIGLVSSMLAADLDDQPPTDRIGWGGMGVFIERAGQILVISDQQYGPGVVHGFGSVDPYIGLWREGAIDVFELDGTEHGYMHLEPGPATLAGIQHDGHDEYVNVVDHGSWSSARARSLYDTDYRWPIYGSPTLVFAGNLHGDGDDELVFIDGWSVALEIDPGGAADCWHELPLPTQGQPNLAVFGDHDGDSDDELAIRTELGEVVLFDGS